TCPQPRRGLERLFQEPEALIAKRPGNVRNQTKQPLVRNNRSRRTRSLGFFLKTLRCRDPWPCFFTHLFVRALAGARISVADGPEVGYSRLTQSNLERTEDPTVGVLACARPSLFSPRWNMVRTRSRRTGQ